MAWYKVTIKVPSKPRIKAVMTMHVEAYSFPEAVRRAMLTLPYDRAECIVCHDTGDPA